MLVDERLASIVYATTGDDTWIGDLNTALLGVQVIAYFTAIFRFLYRKKRAIRDTTWNAEWLQKEWILGLMILFAVLFAVVMVCYVIWPRTDAWLIQILNIIAMSYLVFNSVAHPALLVQVQPETAEVETPTAPALSEQQMKEICEKASGRAGCFRI